MYCPWMSPGVGSRGEHFDPEGKEERSPVIISIVISVCLFAIGITLYTICAFPVLDSTDHRF